MPICTKIEQVETIDLETDMLRVYFDNNSSALMLYSYADALKYLDKEVIVTFRKDIYNGIIQDFINTLTEPTVINVLPRMEHTKLYCEDVQSYSNVCFADIDEGDVSLNAVVYCSDIIFESSPKATWANLTILDKCRRIAHLRLFDPEVKHKSLKGTYIKCDLRKSQYGFTSDAIYPTQDLFALNPEVNIATKFIYDAFADNPAFREFLNSSRLLEFMEKHVDYEPGYIAVRTAIELSIANELENCLGGIDFEVIKQAIVASKAYVISPQSQYSAPFTSIIVSSRSKFNKSKETLVLLDVLSDTTSPERTLFEQVQKMADSVIKVKKGVL